jgi:hypothetical protein
MSLCFLPTIGNTTTTYTDLATWEAAVGTYTPVDIGGQVPDGTILSLGTPLNLPYNETLTFDIDLEGHQVPTTWATWSGGKTPAVLYAASTTLNATFSDGVNAFGMEMEPQQFDLFDIALTLSDGTVLSQTVNGLAGAAFFGWSGGDVTSMNITNADPTGFAIGDMVKGAQVPEPCTVLLLGAGLAGVGLLRRRVKT